MNKNYKIGIITMHRVRNNGSALQAYALQSKIIKLGFDSEIIDYIFPNKLHTKSKEKVFIQAARQLKRILIKIILGFPIYIQKKRFKKFYKKYYRLSAKTYSSKDELEKNPPYYDLLITGSDQVWNPKHIGMDTTFMCSFCKDDTIHRISFASSFASNNIPERFKPLYAKYLSNYNALAVRENSGVSIINDLIQQPATVTCDPTLLLDKLDWLKIADSSKIKINKPYILAYILTYAYNPYPEIIDLIKKLQDRLGFHIVFLNGRLSDYKFKNSTVIRNAGPSEFVKLFMDAEYVITTSFHGTAFALNFSVPLSSVVNNKTEDDSRMINLLHLVGAGNRAISIDATELTTEPMDYSIISNNIQKLRDKSMRYLFNAIKNNLK